MISADPELAVETDEETGRLRCARHARKLASASLYGAALTCGFERVRLERIFILSDVFLLVSTLFLLPAVASTRSGGLRAARPLLLGIALIGVGGLLGTSASPAIAASLTELGAFTVLTAWVIVLVAVWSPDLGEIHLLVWCYLISVTTSSLYALIFDSGDANGRALGLTTHPNQLAMLCVLSAGPAGMLAVSHNGCRRIAAIALSATFPLGLLFSGSRAGFFGYLAVLLFAISLPHRRVVIPAFLAGPFIAAALVLTGVVHLRTPNTLQRVLAVHNPRVERSLDYSNVERRELLNASLARIERHPLTGDGFAHFFAPHDIYLQLWASAGLLGLIGFGLIIWQTLAPAWAEWREPAGSLLETPAGLLALGLAAGFSGYLVTGLFQNALSDRFLWFAPALISVLWPGVREPVEIRSKWPAAQRRRRPATRLPRYPALRKTGNSPTARLILAESRRRGR